MKVGTDAFIIPVNPGTEIAAMLAGQADVAIAYQPSVAAAEAQGAKVVFDFSNYIGPFCNTGIMVLPTTIAKDPEMVQAPVTCSRKPRARPMPTPPSPSRWRARNSRTCRVRLWTRPSTPS